MLERKKVDKIPDSALAKWSRPVLQEGYVPFPKRLIRCMDNLFLKEHAIDDLRVVLAIVDYRRENLARPPSYEYLAFVAGMSIGLFQERVVQMEQQGLLHPTGPDEAVSIGIDGLMRRIVELTESTEESP